MKLLITADWHIRGTAPRCRTDEDWLESQRLDVAFVVDTAISTGATLCIVGDIFHTPRSSTRSVNMLIAELQRVPLGQLFILAGNHDLPYHSYDHVNDSSIGTLLQYFPELNHISNGVMGPVDAYPFGLDKPGKAPLRFIHRLIFPDNESRPMAECGQTAEELAQEFPDNQTIICGDYHHSFTKTFPSGQAVINPGCLNIQAADMIGYLPKVCILDTETGIQEWVNIPQRENTATAEYLVIEKERDERLETFLSTVEAAGAVSLSFRDNLDKRAVKAPKEVQEIITGVVQEACSESI